VFVQHLPQFVQGDPGGNFSVIGWGRATSICGLALATARPILVGGRRLLSRWLYRYRPHNDASRGRSLL